MAFFLLHIGVTGLAIRYLRIATFLPVRYMQTLLPPSLPYDDQCIFEHDESELCKFGHGYEREMCMFRHEDSEDETD